MNDSDFAELQTLADTLLDNVVLDQYYGPPSGVDDGIAALCLALMTATPDQRQSFMPIVGEQRRRVLGRYTLRAPMLAVRARAPDHVHTGLFAYTLIRRHVSDWRDDLVAFAPYHHVARLLGLSPQTLFDDAAEYAVPELAQVMQTFGRRTDVTLGAFGWREIEIGDGPTFETIDWHNSPTGAVVGERSWEEVNRAQVDELLRWVEASRRREEREREQ
jgi:hypothetical protein